MDGGLEGIGCRDVGLEECRDLGAEACRDGGMNGCGAAGSPAALGW